MYRAAVAAHADKLDAAYHAKVVGEFVSAVKGSCAQSADKPAASGAEAAGREDAGNASDSGSLLDAVRTCVIEPFS